MNSLHEDHYTFLIIYHSFLPRMRNVADRSVESIKMYILCSITFFLKPYHL